VEYLDGLVDSEPAVRKPFELGRAAMDAGSWDEAIGYFKEAMRHAAGSELVALHALIGRSHYTPGRWDQAQESYEESARQAERCGDMQGKASALDNIGMIWRDKGKLARALANHEAAFKLARGIGARREEAAALGHIGSIHLLDGEVARPLGCFEDALKIHEETDNRYGQAKMLILIALVGPDEEALQNCEKALQISREIGSKKLEASALGQIGFLWNKKGELEKALKHYEKAFTLFRAIGAKREEAGALDNLGSVLYESGKPEQATAMFLAALETFPTSGFIDGPERYRFGLGKCLAALGRDDFAAACQKAGMPRPEAEKLAEELPAPAKN